MKTLYHYNKTVNIEITKKLGNVYTHPYISTNIIQQVASKPVENNISVLDPSVGSGSFYHSAREVFKCTSIDYDAYDIDENALNLIEDEDGLNKNLGDFLLMDINKKYDYIITNPPYVAYKNIKEKETREKYISDILDSINYDDLGITREEIQQYKSDLYLYFFLKSLPLLKEDGELIFLCADTWFESSFGAVLKKVLSNNYVIETIVNSHYYPFFNEYTNAIVTKIKRRKQDVEYKTTVYSILEPSFVLTKEMVLNNDELEYIFYKEVNTKNSLIIIPRENEKTKIFINKNQKRFTPLKNLVNFHSSGIDIKEVEDCMTDKQDNADCVPFFFQKQARINKPANYKINFLKNDIKNFINLSIIEEKMKEKINKNTFCSPCLFGNVINKFPLTFTYPGKVVVSSKYKVYNFIDKNIDKRLLPLVLNNIFTIQSMEKDFKNSNKRSSTKNENGVIKEMRKTTLENLMVPDFSLLTEEQIDDIMMHFNKYKDLQIFDLDTALENKDYFEVQRLLFGFLDMKGDFGDVVQNTRKMYYIRMRSLKKLGLPLVD